MFGFLRASLLVILVRGVTTVMTALRSAFLSCTWCTLISNTLPMAHCRPCRGRILTLLCSMRAAPPCCVLTAGQAVVVVQLVVVGLEGLLALLVKLQLKLLIILFH